MLSELMAASLTFSLLLFFLNSFDMISLCGCLHVVHAGEHVFHYCVSAC